jgi:UDP-galactopyranose mutase
MYDVLCFSHLRWDFVFQRPQHLLSRCARERRVYFFEEPMYGDGAPELRMTRSKEGVSVLVPHLPEGREDDAERLQRQLIEDFVRREQIESYVSWYYTPMALPFTDGLTPLATVYDCMDQLSAFKGAPTSLTDRENELFARADVVFCGGQSLYESKKSQHGNIHVFPSSVDVDHFARARTHREEPADQAGIPHPRLGFFGVIDERMDLALLDAIAAARPDFQIVLVGPVVKIDPDEIPKRPNIHCLGGKSYAELPKYISGWDVAILPFARNESTQFISPTKTPEYLAAGKPVVSTSIRDVVRPYQSAGLVRIADEPGAFVDACQRALNEAPDIRTRRADAFLSRMSWDITWDKMHRLIDRAVLLRSGPGLSSPAENEELPLAAGAS